MNSKKTVHVAVGVIKQDKRIFICKRPQNSHQGGLWEFPGGKVEAGETVTQALKRELAEEVAINVKTSTPFLLIEHDYGDKKVRLDIHLVENFSGTPRGEEGQPSQWVAINDLANYDFPAANRTIIDKLTAQFITSA